MKKLIILSVIVVVAFAAVAFNSAKAVPVGPPQCADGKLYTQLYVSGASVGVWCATPEQIAAAKVAL